MKASVIVLSWNGRGYLPACLQSLLGQTYPDYEVIVVDNASSDGSAELVGREFPQVRLICNAQNLGFAAGMNVGIRAAIGQVLVLLNQDTEVSPDWLTNLLGCLAADERNGVVGCKVLYPDRRTIQHAGGILPYPTALADHHGYRRVDRGQYDEEKEVDYVTGAALALSRSLLDSIGLLDEGFFPGYYEEADLCRRARRSGYRVVYCPRSTLVHHESTSVVRDSYDYFCAYHAGRLRFVLKHYSAEQILEDFAPAERAWLGSRVVVEEKQALRQTYSRARSNLSEIRASGRVSDRESDPPEVEQWLADALAGLETAADELLRPAPIDPLAVYMEKVRDRWEVREQPFASPTPVVGPLLVRFRAAWNSISTKWYVRSILQQQNEFNWGTWQALQEVCIRLGQAEIGVRESRARLDRAESALRETARLLDEIQQQLRDLSIRAEAVEYSAAENDRQTVALTTDLARLRLGVQRMGERMDSLRDGLSASAGGPTP